MTETARLAHRPRRVVVTGGAGFIGSHLVDALVRRGDHVTVLDDLSTGRLGNLEAVWDTRVRIVPADVREGDHVRWVFERVRPEVVFHLAAQVDVRRAVAAPADDAATNVLGAINVLAAARETDVRRVVNTSTGGGIYGTVDVIPTPESIEPAPESPYGVSKLCAEQYCDWATRLHGLQTVTLRYGNVYGPRQDPHGDAGVIAIFCGRALEGRAPTVYGDGLQTRDFIHVSDVVRANIAAATAPGAQGAYNVGTEREISVLGLIAELRRVVPEWTAATEFVPSRPGEVLRSALDATRARAELGWSARTSLAEGLRSTCAALDAEASAGVLS